MNMTISALIHIYSTMSPEHGVESPMLKLVNLILATCILMLTTGSLAYAQETASQPMTLKFISLDGREVDVSLLKGKVILIDRWATWCTPCLRGMAHIKEVYEKYNERGFEVIGISMDEASAKERVQQIIAQKDLPWPQRFQGIGFQGDSFRKLYRIKSLPTVFLLDKEGNIVNADAQGDRLEPLLKKYLGL